MKNRSVGPELVLPNMTIGVDVVFEEILALTRVRHKTHKRVIVQTKQIN